MLGRGPLRNRAKYARVHNDPAGAIALYEQSLDFQDRGVASHQFLIPYAKALRFVGRSEDAMAQVDAVLDWSRQIGALRSEAIARQYRGLLLLEDALCNSTPPDPLALENARQEMQSALRLHEESGFRQGYKETSVDLFELEVQAGNLDAAISYLRKGDRYRDVQETGDDALVIAVLSQLRANGELQRAERIGKRLESVGWQRTTEKST